MTSTILNIVLSVTTVIGFVGWWYATRRIVFLDAVIEAAKTEFWPEVEA